MAGFKLWASQLFFAHCKQSKTRGGNGLGMRLAILPDLDSQGRWVNLHRKARETICSCWYQTYTYTMDMSFGEQTQQNFYTSFLLKII